MRLSELMSNMDLAVYPQIALVIFLAVFAGVMVRVFSKKKTKDYEEASRLPLDD
jgi:cbb3-type cytochrome oxidase subunit 3